MMPARGAGDSLCLDVRLSPAPRALVFSIHGPGVPPRFTPGFMLPPAPRAEFVFVPVRAKRSCYLGFIIEEDLSELDNELWQILKPNHQLNSTTRPQSR